MADGISIPRGQIAVAICQVMAAATRVPKNGHNKFHGYKYATEGDLLSVIRPAMAEAGLALLPHQAEVGDPDEFGNVRVKMEYTLIHASGEVWPEKLVAYGVGNDRAKNGNDGDKAIYKAVTGANKYLMFKLFQVSTGDDPEAEETAAEDRPRSEVRKPKAVSRDDFKRLIDGMRATETLEDQRAWYSANASDIRQLPKDWQDELTAEGRARAEKFNAQADPSDEVTPDTADTILAQLTGCTSIAQVDELAHRWKGALIAMPASDRNRVTGAMRHQRETIASTEVA